MLKLAGNTVLPFGLPGHDPPTARFRITKKGLWNSSVPLMLFWMLAEPALAPSSIQVMADDVQLIAYVWYDVKLVFTFMPLYETWPPLSQWIVPRTFDAELMCSMMSISPQPGHGTLPMLEPSIQNAGHRPCPFGPCMRPSMRP